VKQVSLALDEGEAVCVPVSQEQALAGLVLRRGLALTAPVSPLP
jgi:hypothetical protein